MVLTTGYDVQGYFITEYIDVIFDEMLVGLGFGKSILSGLDNFVSALTGSEATEMINKLNAVKTELRTRLVNEAKQRGADALIGIDFESSRLGDLIMVSMTATAVKLDKIDSPLPVLQSDVIHAQEVKLQEEKAQRLATLKANLADFDSLSIINVVQSLQTTKEIVTFITELAPKYPEIFDEEFITQLNRCIKLERMYGNWRSDTIQMVTQHLEGASTQL